MRSHVMNNPDYIPFNFDFVRKLPEMQQPDIIILGGGPSGLSTALHLNRLLRISRPES